MNLVKEITVISGEWKMIETLNYHLYIYGIGLSLFVTALFGYLVISRILKTKKERGGKWMRKAILEKNGIF